MIYYFNEQSTPKLNQVGGKAKALIETTKAGFPVPEGIALSVTFFNEWLNEVKASIAWETMLADTTKKTCDFVKAIAANMTFSDVQAKAFKESASKLAGEVFAVRSSSPEEDLEGTSFAGMYETLLGVNRSGLEKAIAQAFSSCFDFRVMEYKKQNDIGLENTCIAVIVQKQIASDVSGVGFSLNPLNNAYDEVVINASFGLGEAIVSGIVTPDSYIVDSTKNEIIEKKIADKKIGLWLNKDNLANAGAGSGGMIKKVNRHPKWQALSDNQIMALSKLIKKCETHYKKPMDIEWAFEEKKLYLLQSRPITTYLPLFEEMLTKPGENKMLYLDMIALTQGFAESFSPMGMDAWQSIFNSLAGLSFPEGKDGIYNFFHGRQYILVPNMLKGMGKLGDLFINAYDGSVKRAMDTAPMEEYKVTKPLPEIKKTTRVYIKIMLKMMPQTIRATFSDYRVVENEYLDAVKAMRENFNEVPDGKTSIMKTEQFFRDELIKCVMKQGATIAGMLALRGLNKKFKGKGVDEYLDILTMDSPSNPTSQMGKDMAKLAAFSDIKQTKTSAEFVSKLNSNAYSEAFLKAYDDYMAHFGARCYCEIDIAVERSYERPDEFFDRLKDINTDDNRILTMKKRRDEGYQKLLAVAKKHKFEKKFIKKAEIVNALFGYRESKKFDLVVGVDFLRRATLNIADEFVKQGRLDDRSHIFDLLMEEVQKAQDDESFDIRKARETNIAPYERVRSVKNWPLLMDSRGKIFTARAKSEDGDLVGDPIANGKYTGKAKVMLSPNEKRLEPGEILVTVATEPSWTPIFVNASAVVMEVGGSLQHGGIIAREYGIPCVSGLTGATQMIKDGDILEVDGSNGIVKIIQV
jgi:rifampicin phosphotransferase